MSTEIKARLSAERLAIVGNVHLAGSDALSMFTDKETLAKRLDSDGNIAAEYIDTLRSVLDIKLLMPGFPAQKRGYRNMKAFLEKF